MAKRYPQPIKVFIYDHYKEMTTDKLTKEVNNMFGTSYTVGQMQSYKRNHHLYSNKNTRFCKGHIPANKGKKGVCAVGSEKGWFKKGQVPHNTVPIGSESVTSDYVRVKIAEPNRWKFKHILVYEQVHGQIPAGNIVIFLDGNRRNCNPENLALITRQDNAVLNRSRMRQPDGDITKCAITLSRIAQVKRKRIKHLKKQGGNQ